MNRTCTTLLFVCGLLLGSPSRLSAQAARIEPAAPAWGETLTLTYTPGDSTRFDAGDEVYAVLIASRPEAREDAVAKPMALRDGVFTLSVPVDSGLSYVMAHFVTLADHDEAARVGTMVYRPDGTPAPGARAASLFGSGGGDPRTLFQEEFAHYPDNFSAYRTWWFFQSQSDTAAAAVRRDLEAMRRRVQGEPLGWLYAQVYGYMTIGEEPAARDALRRLAARYPTESLTVAAFEDYHYLAFSKQVSGEGPDEVERLQRDGALAHPASGLARATLGRLVHDRDVPLEAVEAIAERWMAAEPENPDPYRHLATAYLTRGARLDRAADVASRGVNLLLKGYARLYGDLANGGARYVLPALLAAQSEIALRRGDYGGALGAARTAQAVQMESDGRAFALEARAWQALGERDRAMEAYVSAWRRNTPGAEDSLRVLYTARHGSPDGFDAYLDASARETVGAKPAPAFTAAALDGTSYDLAALRGKVVVLNFWFVGCAPCRVEIPGLNTLVEAFAGQPVVFLAPALDDAEALRAYLADQPFAYTILPNAGDLAARYDVSGYPTHLVIDQEGRIAGRLTGGSAERHDDLRPLISRLLR